MCDIISIFKYVLYIEQYQFILDSIPTTEQIRDLMRVLLMLLTGIWMGIYLQEQK